MRLAYSRYVAGHRERALYRDNRELFSMTPQEAQHSQELGRQGYTVLPDFFDSSLIDRLFEKADRLLRSLHVDPKRAYSVQNQERDSLEGLSYEELAATEKMIAVKEPLLSMPEFVPIAFHESILRIATNVLGYVPPFYQPLVVRDFPADRPRESRNVHKDNAKRTPFRCSCIWWTSMTRAGRWSTRPGRTATTTGRAVRVWREISVFPVSTAGSATKRSKNITRGLPGLSCAFGGEAWRSGPGASWERCGEAASNVSCFSFYANKTITTGEGGDGRHGRSGAC
jgi:hypothetical protein